MRQALRRPQRGPEEAKKALEETSLLGGRRLGELQSPGHGDSKADQRLFLQTFPMFTPS